MEEFVEISFDILDTDALLAVFSAMDPEAVLALCESSNMMENYCSDEKVFEILLAKHFPWYNKSDTIAQMIDDGKSNKEIYERLAKYQSVRFYFIRSNFQRGQGFWVREELYKWTNWAGHSGVSLGIPQKYRDSRYVTMIVSGRPAAGKKIGIVKIDGGEWHLEFKPYESKETALNSAIKYYADEMQRRIREIEEDEDGWYGVPPEEIMDIPDYWNDEATLKEILDRGDFLILPHIWPPDAPDDDLSDTKISVEELILP